MAPLILLLLCLSIFIEPSLANASTYYVAKSGSDGMSCAQSQSQATPRLTITAGLTCLSGGDTLYIKAGIYAESISGQIPSGTSSTPTLISGYQSDVVIIRPSTGGVVGDVIDLRGGRSYITLSKVVIDATNVINFGVRLREAVHHIRIENSEIKNASLNSCMSMSGADSYDIHHVTFSNLKVHDCGDSVLDHGIYTRGTDHIIENCEIYNISSHGVHIYSTESAGANDRHIVRNNRIHHVGARGILLGSGDGHVAYNNLVWSNADGIVIGYGAPRNNKIYNNTIYSHRDDCIDIKSEAVGSIVRNNICWKNAKNAVTDNGSGTIISNHLTTDPKFRDPATLDFRLTQGSPAINEGTSVTVVERDYLGIERPQGSSYDIGAYEWTLQSQDVSAPAAPSNLRIN
jgi:hypothetical protein